MNTVTLLGRLTRDPEIRYAQQSNMPVARFTLAVDRKQQNQDDSRSADFISCIAFDKRADFAQRYLHQGSKIAIRGHIQTGSYTKQDGTKVYTTEVVIDEQEFAESRQQAQQQAPQNNYGQQQGYNARPAYNAPQAPQQAPQYQPAQQFQQQSFVGDGFMDIPSNVDDPGLPFN